MIIEYDFGKRTRLGEKTPPRAGGEAQPGPPIGHVRPGLESAHTRLVRLETALRRAAAAATADNHERGREKMLVDAAEYARLLRCKEIVVASLAEH